MPALRRPARPVPVLDPPPVLNTALLAIVTALAAEPPDRWVRCVTLLHQLKTRHGGSTSCWYYWLPRTTAYRWTERCRYGHALSYRLTATGRRVAANYGDGT